MRRALPMVAFLVALPVGMRALALWHGRGAGALFEGDRETHEEQARGVARWVDADLDRGDFTTGDPRYDGEWLFATRMMAAIGYAQSALEHPELRQAHAASIDRCLEALSDPSAR